ncbi:MAG: mechanosensitive ion channel family protein [Bacteroidetes bacterium]|nr:mechanosensitive ion channel family protein [Bacteroidota bacterium]
MELINAQSKSNVTSKVQYLRCLLIAALCLVLTVPCSTNFVFAQATISAPTAQTLRSPHDAISLHINNLQNDQFKPELAAKTLAIVAKNQDSEKLAIQLKQIFDAKGLYVDTAVAPKDPNYVDGNGTNRYYPFKLEKRIYLEKIGVNWVYSQRTVEEIPAMYKDIFPFGVDFLVNLIPKFGSKKLLGLDMWQYIGILILIFISFVVHRIFTLVFRIIIKRLAIGIKIDKKAIKLIKKIARPLSLFLITIVLVLFVPALQLPINISKYTMMVINALTPIFGTIFFYRFVDLLSLFFAKLAEKTESTLDDQLIPLVKKTLKVFIAVIGTLYILHNLEFNITAILAGLSLGGLAFALAAQDTLKNFFGSIMIFIDKPFQIGDYIRFEGVDGTVEEIGFRSTRVRTFANSLVYIPNARVADLTVDNMGMRAYRRFTTKISVMYDTPPMLIEEFVDGLKKMIEAHPDTRKDYYEIHLNEMGDSSLNILFYIFFEVPDWSGELKARHEIIIGIMKLAEDLGVNFAFPTQTLQVENFPGKESLSPVYEKDQTVVRSKVKGFIETFGKQKNESTEKQ